MTTVPPVDRPAVSTSCHEDSSAPQAPADAPVVVLSGAPNVGKSTLFNALTGARRTVGNWPGTTVEVGRGACPVAGRVADVVDLPGSYSLDPLSPDEALTRDVVLAQGAERPDAVVVVASAAHLARSLYLVAQVRETPLPVVVALTMRDVAARYAVQEGFEVRVLRGDLEVMGRRFTVQNSSQLRFTGPALTPDINATAEHHNERAGVKVFVNVRGQGKELTIKPTSEPPLPETEIYTLLATGRRTLRAGSGASYADVYGCSCRDSDVTRPA